MWTILKVFDRFCSVFKFWPQGMGDLNSPNRDQTRNPCIEKQSFSHWTTKEVPPSLLEQNFLGFPGGSMVKNPPGMQETQVWSLVQKDLLERKRQPTPVFLSGKFHGQRSLAGYSPRGCKSLKKLGAVAADLCDLALRSAVKCPTPRWQCSNLPSPHISRALSARTALPAALAREVPSQASISA